MDTLYVVQCQGVKVVLKNCWFNQSYESYMNDAFYGNPKSELLLNFSKKAENEDIIWLYYMIQN
jgi:hypothetical protein